MRSQHLCIVALIALVPPSLRAQEASSWTSEQIAAKLGYSLDALENPTARSVTFQTLGITVTEAKALVRATQEPVTGCFDASGQRQDFSKLLNQERSQRALTPAAKLHVLLTQHLATHPRDLVPLTVWLSVDIEAIDRHTSETLTRFGDQLEERELAQRVEAELAAYAMDVCQGAVNQGVAEIATLGLTVRARSSTAPVVFLDVPAAKVIELATLPSVDTLYLDLEPEKGESNDNANKTHRTKSVHQAGIRGQGIRAANLGGLVDPGNPFVPTVASFNAAAAPGGHGTQVAGCLGSRYPGEEGAAPDVDLYSANPNSLSDSDVTAAGDWIITRNVDVTNMSYWIADDTLIRYQDRYFEYQSRVYRDSYVTAAGNKGSGTGYVVSPSKGWNVLTVGSHTDGGNGNWTGDAMNSFSSFTNPVTGCEKPNVAANGDAVITTDLAPNFLTPSGVSGTSYASPHCAGNLANAMSMDTTIITYPEAAMALMMATAWHNIEGSTRLSDKDGAGGIHGLAAVRKARQVLAGTLSSASFSNNGYFTQSLYLTAGDRTRVCFAWSANAASNYSSHVLDADLDITILGGLDVTSGVSYGSSSSFNNNFEIVEFTPPTTGYYTVRVNDYRFDGTLEYYGLSWSKKYADTSDFKLRERTSKSAPTAGPTVGNSDYFLDFDAPNSPSATYLMAPSVTAIGPGTSYSSLTWHPLNADAITDLWLDSFTTGPTFWYDSIGTLTSGGASSTNRVVLHPNPALVGLRLFHIGLTIQSGWPDNVKETSVLNEARLWPTPINKPTSDDGYFVQNLPAGFKFFGQPYTQCAVNMNGNITFGGSSSDFTPTIAEFLNGGPRLAFLWDDLKPNVAGLDGTPLVRVREIFGTPGLHDQVVIEFINVPEYSSPATTSNTVRVTLTGGTGQIKIEYLDCTAQDAIVGISPGTGLSNASEINLTSSGAKVGGANEALFEEFTTCSFLCLLGSPSLDLDSSDAHWNTLTFTPVDQFTNQNRYRVEMEVR